MSNAKPAVEISVVIATYRQPALLQNVLNRLSEQIFDQKKFEVIVLEGGNCEKTKQVVESFEPKIRNIKLILKKQCSLSESRDIGFSIARGEIIAITDDDTIPNKNWLEKISESFKKNPSALGIEGKITSGKISSLFTKAPVNSFGKQYIGCNTHYRKKVLKEINGHDPEFDFWREDTNIAFKVLEKGEIVFDPSVIVHHPPKEVNPMSVIYNLKYLNDDWKLWKRFPKRTTLFAFRDWFKNFVSSFISYATLFFFLFFFPDVQLMGYILILSFLIRFLLSMQNKDNSIMEYFQFFSLVTLRGLLYPFAFFGYFIVNLFFTHNKEQKCV